MSVEFRQRTPAEYARILWKRKWLIALPTVAVFVAFAWATSRLANVYESTTLLTVRPSTISNTVLPQLSDSDLTIRINNIGQEVVSRTSLEPLIVKYDLYAVERRRGEPMDVLVERMRTHDIGVKINTSRNDITNGFNLSYRAPAPEVAKAVTAELAGKYVNAQTKAATEGATYTKEFFSTKLNEAKEQLDAIDRQRLEVMIRNKDSLPTTAGALVERLSGLYEQQKTYVTEIGRLNDSLTSQRNFLSASSKRREQEIDDVAENMSDPKQSQAYAELVSRKAQMEAEKQQLLTEYKPKHPDVVAKQSQIDSVQREMDKLVDDGKRKVEERRKQLQGRVDMTAAGYESSIRNIENEISRQRTLLGQIEGQIGELVQRINNVPNAEVALSALDREYQSKKAVYDDLLEQQKKAELSADVQATAQGETIAVIDPANLPERPVAPNRPLLIGLGLVLGLGVGLAFAALLEVPRLLTIQSTEDAAHYTNLPVLVSIPELLTPREERRSRMRRVALAAAGVVATVISIPALAFALRFTRVLELFVSQG
ncbi:MAG: GumC family protein [Pyrinomonadaceae bacterium]